MACGVGVSGLMETATGSGTWNRRRERRHAPRGEPAGLPLPRLAVGDHLRDQPRGEASAGKPPTVSPRGNKNGAEPAGVAGVAGVREHRIVGGGHDACVGESLGSGRRECPQVIVAVPGDGRGGVLRFVQRVEDCADVDVVETKHPQVPALHAVTCKPLREGPCRGAGFFLRSRHAIRLLSEDSFVQEGGVAVC